jgi:hypothetical protein
VTAERYNNDVVLSAMNELLAPLERVLVGAFTTPQHPPRSSSNADETRCTWRSRCCRAG